MNIRELFVLAVKEELKHPSIKCTIIDGETLSLFCNIAKRNVCVHINTTRPIVSSFNLSDQFNIEAANDTLSQFFEEMKSTGDKELFVKKTLNTIVLFIDEDIYLESFPGRK